MSSKRRPQASRYRSPEYLLGIKKAGATNFNMGKGDPAAAGTAGFERSGDAERYQAGAEKGRRPVATDGNPR